VNLQDSRKPSGIRSGLLDGLKVLAVENDADTRELLVTILERNGAEVFAADSAAEALDIIKRRRPDVLLSDIGMPDEDGYSLIRKVRQYEAQFGNHLPAAALTAFAKSEEREAALSAGFDHHVSKPLEVDQLPRMVAELAIRHRPVAPN
jgi:CheY-like chemotaxis protein